MQTGTSGTQYPPLSLKILRKYPEDPFPLPNLFSSSTIEKPSREVSPFPTEPPNGPSKNQYFRKIVSHGHGSSVKKGNPLARLIDGKMAALITNKSQEKMLKAFEGIQQIRTASEARIRQNVENLNEIDEEPPEEIDWKEMVKTGKYIGFRESPKKDIRLSGIALKKEKNFQNIRRTIGDLKYELKNKDKVVKYFTGKPNIGPEGLALPQITPFDSKVVPQNKKEEPERLTTTADNGRITPVELIEGIADLQMPAVEAGAEPPDEDKEFIIAYNKQQIKKLRSSINHVQRVALKNRLKKAFNTEEIFGKEPNSKDDDGISPITNKTSPRFNIETPFRSGSESSRKKMLSKKQIIEERIKNQTPKDELLKKILQKTSSALPEDNSRASFFLTSADSNEFIQALQNAAKSKTPTPVPGESASNYNKFKSSNPSTDNTFTSQFYLPQRFSAGPGNPQTSQQQISEISSTHLINQIVPPRDSLSRFGKSSNTSPTLLRNNNNITTSERPGKSPRLTAGGKNRSYLIKSNVDRKRGGYKIERVDNGNEEMQQKYKMLALECEVNSKSSASINSSLFRNFGEIKEHLRKMDEYVSNEGAEIDWQIKQDIFTEMHNAQVALANGTSKVKLNRK